MFASGFVEAATDINFGHLHPDHDEGDIASDSTFLFRQCEDSDDDEEDLTSSLPDEPSFDSTTELDVPETGTSHAATPVAERIAVKHAEGSAHTESVSSTITGDESRNVRPKLSHPSSPRSKDVSLMTDPDFSSCEAPSVPGPKKMRVIVRDVAYATYKAVLYYV